MQYFLAAAKLMNFTKAAQQLHISQPALSKQISAMEKEWNMQLFVREQNKLRLTPAGMVLADRLPGLQQQYDELLEYAGTVNAGHTGALTIGNLEGQWVSDRFSETFRTFTLLYPGISVNLVHHSFSGLRNLLDTGKIDLALTLEFDIADNAGYDYRQLEDDRAYFVISRSHAVARRETISFRDLADAVLISIAPEDSPHGARMLADDCRAHGISPTIRYAPNLSSMMLWVDAGIGVGICNGESPIVHNQNIRVLHEIPLGNANLCLVWDRDNKNPARSLFTQLLLEHAAPGIAEQ